jgi:hypothetical protein
MNYITHTRYAVYLGSPLKEELTFAEYTEGVHAEQLAHTPTGLTGKWVFYQWTNALWDLSYLTQYTDGSGVAHVPIEHGHYRPLGTEHRGQAPKHYKPLPLRDGVMLIDKDSYDALLIENRLLEQAA